MLFSNSLDSLPSDIVLDNTILKQVSNTKFLGVTVDNHLTWKLHIENICKVISRNTGVIYRLKSMLPKSSLFMLYSSLILPYLNYGLLVWGNTYQTFLDKLEVLQNKVIRIICNAPIRSEIDPLFFENNILKLRDLYHFQLGQFMFRFTHGRLPHAFNNMFLRNQNIHRYPTRQANDFHLPLMRTARAQSTFIFEGPKFWNSLSNDITSCPSLNTFRDELKKFLLKSYDRKKKKK